jgi:hypothetical protein
MQPLLAQQQSITDFERVVLPQIKVWLLDCTYISIESTKSDPTLSQDLRLLLAFLDNKSGVDGILMTFHRCDKKLFRRLRINPTPFRLGCPYRGMRSR